MVIDNKGEFDNKLSQLECICYYLAAEEMYSITRRRTNPHYREDFFRGSITSKRGVPMAAWAGIDGRERR